MPTTRFFILSVVLSFPMLSLGCGGHTHSHQDQREIHGALPIGNPSPGECPVMGGEVDAVKAGADASLYADYEGKRYLFCCKKCKPKFEKDPGTYIAGATEGSETGDHSQHGHTHQH